MDYDLAIVDSGGGAFAAGIAAARKGLNVAMIELVAERDSGRVLGVHLLAEGAGDAILAGVYAIEAERTIDDLADSWNPYLTIGEAVHLAALSFTREPSLLSCCAA